MCAIHGFTYKNIDHIKTMIKHAHNRGPDGSDFYYDNDITLGHNLLSIVDEPNNSIQPRKSKQGNILVYNGELYDYTSLGDVTLDTDVLAEGLDREGVQFVKDVDGMFAFGWYDIKDKKLYLVRDHFGVKHIFYTIKDGNLIFSSQIESLLQLGVDRKLDHFSMGLYDKFGYVPGYKTMYNSIKKVVPGGIVCYDLKTKEITYDSLHYKTIQPTSTFNSEQLRDNFSKSVQKSLMGRRPIGLFLSGGLDSSAILHELVKYDNNPHTFTTRFCTPKGSGENQIKDINRSNSDAEVALFASKHYNTTHTEASIKCEDFIKNIDNYIDATELPLYNRTGPAYYLTNKVLSEHGRVVTMAGDGGDEIYTGYKIHNTLYSTINNSHSHEHQIRKWVDKNDKSCLHTHSRLSLLRSEPLISNKEVAQYIRKWFPIHCFGTDSLNNMLFLSLFMQVSEDFLFRNDKLGMRFSMEGRFPHLVQSYVYYILSIPSSIKLTPVALTGIPGTGKYLLRKSYTGHIPVPIINKPMKTGWSAPTRFIWNGVINTCAKQRFDKEYHVNSKELFNWDSICDLHDKEKTVFRALFLRTWMQRFNITI